MSSPIDQAQRLTAITEFDRNIVLTAPAGAGKTTVLVGRIVHWLLGPGWARHSGDLAALEASLVAVTFTRAAAAEMAARVAEDLHALAAGSVDSFLEGAVDRLAPFADPLELRGRAAQLCQQPLNLEITTLHSFCIRLLEPFAEVLGLPSEAQFAAPSPAINRAVRRVVVELLSEEDEPLPPGLPYGAAVGVLEVLVGESSLPDSDLESLAERFDLPFLSTLDDAVELGFTVIEDLVGDAERNLFSGAKSTAEGLARAATSWSEGRPVDWTVLAKASGRLADASTKRFAKLTSTEAAAITAFHAAVRQLRGGDPKPWVAFVEQLSDRVAEARARCRRAGILRFDDAVRLALDVVRDHPTWVRRLQDRLDLFLVDECQDTDPSQCALIEALCRDDKGLLIEGMLFVVGDRAQSIYGFRDADVEAFDRMVERLADEGASMLSLCSNFRSDDSLINATNALFESVASNPLVAARDGRGPGRLNAISVIAERIGAARDLGYRSLAATIRYRIDAGDFRPGEIACLHHGRKAARALAKALHDAGVPAQFEGTSPLLDSQPARDLLCLFADLLKVASQPMIFGWLRSPLSGLSEAEAMDWMRIRNSTADLQAPVPAPLRLIEEARETLAREGVEAAFTALRTAGRVPGAFDVDRRMVDGLESLIDEVIERVNDPRTDLAAWFEDALSSAIDLPTAPSTVEAVRLMTIHGAKGLEFPWTILDMIHHPRSPQVEGQAPRGPPFALCIQAFNRRDAGELRPRFTCPSTARARRV
jgi:ATP-dependent helicase/nuclease subunit A